MRVFWCLGIMMWQLYNWHKHLPLEFNCGYIGFVPEKSTKCAPLRFILRRAFVSPRMLHSGVRWLIFTRKSIPPILSNKSQNISSWVRQIPVDITMGFITIITMLDILNCAVVPVWQSDNWHKGGCDIPQFVLHYLCSWEIQWFSPSPNSTTAPINWMPTISGFWCMLPCCPMDHTKLQDLPMIG